MKNYFTQIARKFSRAIKSEEGATAIEYALIASIVSIVIVVGATNIGTAVGNMFNEIDSEVNKAVND